jgi:hypothetical protein
MPVAVLLPVFLLLLLPEMPDAVTMLMPCNAICLKMMLRGWDASLACSSRLLQQQQQ